MVSKPPRKVINLSYRVFALWWLLILGAHLLTCVFNALYTYSYWKLTGSYLNTCLEFYQIGLPHENHRTIAAVHAVMSTIHGVCILLMVGGSLLQNALAFTPWSSSVVGREVKTKPTNSSPLLQTFSRAYSRVTYPLGLCGVNGKYFDVALICRETVETALQTVQAYRMSTLLPRTLLNRFYVVLLAVNCWSSLIADSVFFGHDEARRRFACIALDCLLDLMACTGVALMVLLSYVHDYDFELRGFNQELWYDDEWVARALNELRMVAIVSWSDLISRTIFSLGLIITTTSMKRLLWRLPRNANRVNHSATSIVIAVGATRKFIQSDKVKREGPAVEGLQQPALAARVAARLELSFSHSGRSMLRTVHFLFGVWGMGVLVLHIHASMQPTLPQCLMQVRPWATSRPSCYLLDLNCHSLNIAGVRNEVHDKWIEFDASTVVQLLIRHCPKLEVPDIFTRFRSLRGIKVYNSSIVEWGESAAITASSHPQLMALFLARVNMTDGLLPLGLQSDQFPQSLYDIEFCATNLRELPDDLDSKWPAESIIYVENSQLTEVPSVLARLSPNYLSVSGNPITELPAEIFEIEGLLYLAVSELKISELPRNVPQLALSLSRIYITNTNISFFWSWMDDFVRNTEAVTSPLRAAGSTYCNDLERLEDGTAMSLQVPLSPEYSTILMDAADENRQAILKAVNCSIFYNGLLYPLSFDDSINAISAPPAKK